MPKNLRYKGQKRNPVLPGKGFRFVFRILEGEYMRRSANNNVCSDGVALLFGGQWGIQVMSDEATVSIEPFIKARFLPGLSYGGWRFVT